MNTNTALDLQTYRCPEAMIRARKGIDAANKIGLKEFSITTIEPMLFQHVKAYTKDLGILCSIEKTNRTPISDEMIRIWQDNNPFFDLDDLENVSELLTITIKIQIQTE